MPTVTLFSTSTPVTLRAKSSIRRLEFLLNVLKVEYTLVDLAQEPHKLLAMLRGSNGDTTLPQLHINGCLVGDIESINERHDFGELVPMLKGQ